MSLPDIQDAHALIQRGETQQAIAMLEQLAAAFPRYATTYVLMAQAYERDERWDRALTAWQMASFFMPNSAVLRRGVQRSIHAATQKYRRTLRPPTPPPAPHPADTAPPQDDLDARLDAPPANEAAAVEPAAVEAVVEVEAASPSVVPDPDPTDAAWVDLDEDEAAAPVKAEHDEPPAMLEQEPEDEPAPPQMPRREESPLAPAADVPAEAAVVSDEPTHETRRDALESDVAREETVTAAPDAWEDEPDPATPEPTPATSEASSRDAETLGAFDADEAEIPFDAEEESIDAPPAAYEPSLADLREGLADEFEDLDRLIDELDGARIVPNTDPSAFPEPALEDDVDDVVSETLARIYATQHKYAEAARVYDMLAEQNPDQADAYREHARAMRNRQN